MKLKKKKDQSVDASVLLRKGNKILTGTNMEIKCRAETEGNTNQNCPTWEFIPYTVTKPGPVSYTHLTLPTTTRV